MQKLEDFPIIMTATDVAKFLQIARPTAYELMRRTDFPSFSLSGVVKGSVRVKRDDLMNWLESRKVQSA